MDYMDYMNMDVDMDMDIWIYYIWKNKTYIRHIILHTIHTIRRVSVSDSKLYSYSLEKHHILRPYLL